MEEKKETIEDVIDNTIEAEETQESCCEEGTENDIEIEEAAEESEVDSDKGGADTDKKEKRKKKSAKALEIELDKKEAEVTELKDKYQRLMAEFENARKRTQKESIRMYDVGAKEVLSKLLPVVDNFERGLAAVSDEEKDNAFVQGIDAIYKQLMTAFDEMGVHPMNAAGTEFNPDLHNAVMHVEDEEMGENLVAEEFQKGYMYKEEVLRHSMVKVVN